MPELPGHGTGPSLPEASTMRAYVEKIALQLPSSADDRWCLVGHSMGGYLASSLASTFPWRMAGLALFHSKAGADNDAKKQDRLRAIATVRENKALYVRGMINGTFHPDNRKSMSILIDQLVQKAMHIPTEAIVAAQEAMIERPDRLNDLRKLDIPIHFFAGAEDQAVPLAVIREEVLQLPQSTLQVCAEAGHMGQWEKPEEVIRFIEKFVAAC
jgi:pimeloyl-ACP methyl ester carboxylesterase